MRNLRDRYTYEQRNEFQQTINNMRVYILPLLLQRQNDVCNKCKKPSDNYDIHHTIYNPMITIKELEALCIPCHKEITKYK